MRNHPSKARVNLPLGLLAVALLLPLLARADSPIVLKSVKFDLPDDSEMFAGDRSDAINNNCLACHSASMVLNQPALPRAKWQAVVDKMIKIYKAPIEAGDVAPIVDYLARMKGAE